MSEGARATILGTRSVRSQMAPVSTTARCYTDGNVSDLPFV